MHVSRFLTFQRRVLDPDARLGEILFGLIMTLTFTLGAGLVIQTDGREGARELLVAIVGCNIAWGVIDGALYLVSSVFNRARLRRVGRMVRNAPDDHEAAEAISAELDDLLAPALPEAARERLYRRIVDHLRIQPEQPVRITKSDWWGSVASFWLVFIASLPAAVPFLLINDPFIALRVSNGILLAMLFVTGYSFAQHTMGRPWLFGVSLLGLGFMLVVIAIALGG